MPSMKGEGELLFVYRRPSARIVVGGVFCV
jgi:hypothetical protein